MGQKVNPIGLRIGINKDWLSNWYADPKEVPKILNNDLKIRKFLNKKLKDSSIGDIQIRRTEKGTDVIVHSAKPGMIIGQQAEGLKKLTAEVEKIVNEKVRISVKEIREPYLNAKIVADDIAKQIENRVPFRMAQKRAIKSVLRAGALGVKTLASGRLNGVEMARSEGYTEGTVSLHTLRADIDYYHSEADTTYGKIGVKVWIYKGEKIGKENNSSETPKKDRQIKKNDRRGGKKDVNTIKN